MIMQNEGGLRGATEMVKAEARKPLLRRASENLFVLKEWKVWVCL